MTIYKSQSGQTALKVIDEITAVFGACYRLESQIWHHVGNTEPMDPSVDQEVLDGMFNEMVESLDKQNFDLSKSMAEIKDEDFN